jgi:hypothetical protein
MRLVYEADPRAPVISSSMRRACGEETRDVIRRRVLGPRELELYAALAGFEVVEIMDEPGTGPVTGPGAYTIARFQP